MKHTIHLKVSEEAMKHAIHAIMQCSELPDPVSLTGAVRTCFNMGIAALDPGHHLRNVPQTAESLYHKLSGSRESQPSNDLLHQLVSGKAAVNPTGGDPRLDRVSSEDQEKAVRVIAYVDQGHRTIADQLGSTNPEVARLAALIWPDSAEDPKEE